MLSWRAQGQLFKVDIFFSDPNVSGALNFL